MVTIKKTGLAIAMSALVGLGAMGQASAGLYAGSSLTIQDLKIVVTDGAPFDPLLGMANPFVPNDSFNSFDFSVSNTAAMPGSASFTSNSCFGTSGLLSTTCDAGVHMGTPVLIASSPATVGTNIRASGDTTMYGVQGGMTNYANAESVIDRAELVDVVNGMNILTTPGTAIRQVAEVELNSLTGTAQANTTISSTTQTEFSFTLAGSGSIVVSFMADPAAMTDINDNIANAVGGNSSTSVSLQMTNTTDGSFMMWRPSVATGGACVNFVALGGAACNSETASESLNITTTAAAFPVSNDQKSMGTGLQAYYLSVSGLTAGNYAIALNSTVTAQVTRVPEPGVLALMGAGLLGLGLASRRKKAQQA